MRITQCNITSPLKRSGAGWTFIKHYKLSQYDNSRKPTIFFGFYDEILDLKKLNSHKSIAIIFWTGSDILKTKLAKKVVNRSNVYNIAISSFIADDLDRLGAKYKRLPIRGIPKPGLRVCPLGNEIYTYVPRPDKKKNQKRYGWKLVQYVVENCGFKVNVADSLTKYPWKKLLKVYKKCFLCLRFTNHDGLSNTAVEMGIMGRKSFSNDRWLPGGIPWSDTNPEDVVEKIKIEAEKIGTKNIEIAKNMKKYIHTGTDWLDTSFWKQ